MDPKQTIYYGVHIPNDIQVQDSDGSINVFFDKGDALKEVKKYKKARFKAFQFFHEALEFATHGSEFPNNNSSIELNSSKQNETTHTVGEKPSQFRGPKSQDLVKLRKGIENGDLNFVRTTIWENPRYLISSGDTPAILQEGSRYNALHVAAKAKNAEMCNLILTTVGSPDFLQLLYGEENRVNCEEGSKILLDLYLNTPDKGLNETPLHFAVKFGAAEVVDVLVSYPQCDKTVLNKYSDTPKDMICTRVSNPKSTLVNKIALLLEERFFVPVLRSEDNCTQPVIGEPFSPTSPPNLNSNPINPRLEIHAYAGPMKKDEANVFRRKWKTPPRTSSNVSLLTERQTPNKSSDIDLRLQDTDKGLERVGRDLAKKCNVGWKEYWPFLDTFTDLTSQEGLNALEAYIKNRYVTSYNECVTNAVNKKRIENETINSSLTSISVLSSSSAASPITELCKNFEACTLNDNNQPKIVEKIGARTHMRNEYVFDVFTKAGLSPCLCIEKSCQVFANRIAHNIIYQMDTVTVHTIEMLESEIKHLKSLIGSFLDDPTFNNVINFQSVHSRIAYLVALKLKQTLMGDEELEVKTLNLEFIIQRYDKMVDLFSSDDEELNNYNQPLKFVRRKSTSDSRQVICLIEHILKHLECDSENESLNTNVEEDCRTAWANAVPCSCIWKTNKTSRKSSFIKKNSNNKFSNSKASLRFNQYRTTADNVSRKLSFFEDDSELEKGDHLENSDNILNNSEKNSIISNATNETSSSSDEYRTANNSENSSDNESDVEQESFEDVQTDEYSTFIEGNVPTKVDYAVFNAVKNIEIDPNDYPNIYRWRHAIKNIPEEERISWPSPSTGRYRFNISAHPSAMSTPRGSSGSDPKQRMFYSPPQPWIRVTGQNSPIRSLKALKHSISFTCKEN